MAKFRECCLSITVLLLTLIAVSCDDPIVKITETDPPIKPPDDYMKTTKNKDSFLTCTVTNKPVRVDVQWQAEVPDPNTTNGIRIISISTDLSSDDPYKYALEKPSPTAWRLRIQNVQVTDEGKYVCRVQTTEQNYATDEVQLRVVEKPQIADLLTSSDSSHKEGDDVRLTCNATGRPFPVVKWSRMAGELLPGGGKELRAYVLRIPSVQSADAGFYKCSASNYAGSIHRNIFLQVQFPPRAITSSPTIGQAVGYYKDLLCYVEAYPVPAIATWSHSVNPVAHGEHFEISNYPGAYNKLTSILTIKGVRQEDYGTYKCSASNVQGDGFATVELIPSTTPTPDRTGVIRSASSTLAISFTTVIMVLSTCLLHRFQM